MRVSNYQEAWGFLYDTFMMLRMVPIEVYKEKDEKDSLPDSQILELGARYTIYIAEMEQNKD